MAKAKRERRASIRNMSGADDALEALNRLEQLERENAPTPATPVDEASAEDETGDPKDT